MPVMGPGEVRQERVDEVYEETIKFLKDRFQMDISLPTIMLEKYRKETLSEFKDSIKKICQLDIDLSW